MAQRVITSSLTVLIGKQNNEIFKMTEILIRRHYLWNRWSRYRFKLHETCYELCSCRGLPCGVQPPEPVLDPDGDKLATIAARFSYFQEKRSASSSSAAAVVAKVDLRRSINPPARYKNARPTVRLRPRQVLCSKCRSICNENSENVDVSRKRKHEDAQQQSQQVSNVA